MLEVRAEKGFRTQEGRCYTVRAAPAKTEQSKGCGAGRELYLGYATFEVRELYSVKQGVRVETSKAAAGAAHTYSVVHGCVHGRVAVQPLASSLATRDS